MMLMATASCALVTTSCVKGPDDVPPSPTPTPTPTPEEQYDAAFLNYVGGTIASNQDWGFNASVAAARGMTRGKYGQDDPRDGYALSLDPKYQKSYTKNFYDEIFKFLPEGKKVSDDIYTNFEFEDRGPFRFDIIFSYTSQDIEIGYYHYGPNQSPDDRKEKKLVTAFVQDLAKEDYFQYTKNGVKWDTPDAEMGLQMFTVAGANEVQARFFTLRDGSEEGDPIDVPVGDIVGFYVKAGDKKVYTNRYLNENQEDKYFAVLYDDNKDGILYGSYVIGLEDFDSNEDDHDCNDVIIVVNNHLEDTYPLLRIPKPTWRVIGEDLSAEENTDFDFNDIVLDVTLTKEGAECVLQAAGGQLPLRVNYDDNLEVHKLFGVDQKMMVNTINLEKHPELKQYKVDKDPVKFSIKGSFKSVYDVVIQVQKGNQWHELYAKPGGSACKILVKPTFKWPDELESLKVVYPKFIDYVNDPNVKWYP